MRKKGYSRRGFWGDTIHFDENGNEIGRSRKNFWGGVDHFDANDNKTGHSQRNFWGGTDHYNNHGDKIGYSHKTFFGGSNHYDNNDNEIGKSRPNFWGGSDHYSTEQSGTTTRHLSERSAGEFGLRYSGSPDEFYYKRGEAPMIPYKEAMEISRHLSERRRLAETKGEPFDEIKEQAILMMKLGMDPDEYGIHVPESAYEEYGMYYNAEETAGWLRENGQDPKDYGINAGESKPAQNTPTSAAQTSYDADGDGFYNQEETIQWLIANGHDPKDYGF